VLLDELKNIVGEKGWTSDPGELEPHLNEPRGLVTGETPIMVSPRSTEQVSEILQVCGRYGAGVVPQGGNTGLCGGAVPDQSGEQVLLSLSRMNRIRKVEPDDFSITVQAGCILSDVQDAAAAVDRCFALSLGAEGSCQIGGNLSTNAGGINVIRYGSARQQALGLEVVLADGMIWDGLRSLRKDNAGYDMKQVFLGSEGTLGVITAATLRLHPNPGSTTTALLAIDSARQAVELLGYLRSKLADRINAFELISDRCLRYVARLLPDARHPYDPPHSWYVLTEVAVEDHPDAVETILGDALSAELVADAIVAKSEAEANRLWHMRHSISESQRPEGACLKHDISVPIGQIAHFIEESQVLVEDMQPRSRLVVFGHVGDGNLHYNVVQPKGADPEQFRAEGRALTEAIYDLVTRFGGSISAEHGIGVTKKADLLQYRDAVEIQMMRALKQALDPQNILNPGKVI
jgi:FAD/FMN-containing dehydrogenase